MFEDFRREFEAALFGGHHYLMPPRLHGGHPATSGRPSGVARIKRQAAKRRRQLQAKGRARG